MSNINYKKTIVCSLENSINKAKLNGRLDLCQIYKYQILIDQLNYVKNVTKREDLFKQIQDTINELPYTSDNAGIIINSPSILPDSPYYFDNDGLLNTDDGPVGTNNYIASAKDFIVTDITKETLFGIGSEFDMYNFKISDFTNAYSDNNDGIFYAIKIYRDNLNEMNLRYKTGLNTGSTFGEDDSSITILKDQLPKWSLYTSSDTIFKHDIKFSIIDLINNNQIVSNKATLTVDREAFSENQPATIGDITLSVENRAITVLTLATFTSQLTPPYNDPENDLIDAIRINEISTANKGTFYYNGVELTKGQIISREDINAGYLTHESVNQDDIWSDALEFSARDEGSKIWVN